MIDIDTQIALKKLSECETPAKAQDTFDKYFDVLKDWRYLYASNYDSGQFKLNHRTIEGNNSFISYTSVFKGKTIRVIDSRMVGPEHDEPVPYCVGYGNFLDTNIASNICKMAYRKHHQPALKEQLRMIQLLNLDYHSLNPYLYLYENRMHFKSRPENIHYCRQTFAAINALKKIDGPLDEEWSSLYQKYFMDQSEAEVAPYFDEFLKQSEQGKFDDLDSVFNFIQVALIQTKILEMSSHSLPEDKLEQLIRFMADEMGSISSRELGSYADILFHHNKSSLTKKLNSLNKQKDPIAAITNCAWDLFIFRIMDAFSNTYYEPQAHFFVPQLVTSDRDVSGIANLSLLKGIALHTKSEMHSIYLENDPMIWVMDKVGQKRARRLQEVCNFEASQKRLSWMSAKDKHQSYQNKFTSIRNLLHEKQQELRFVIHKMK